MDFLYRSESPRYKGQATAQEGGGMLSGLLRSLLGGSEPDYRRSDGSPSSRSAPARSWLMFGGGTPAYKAAPPAETTDTVETQPIECVCSELDDSQDEDDGCGEDSGAAATEIYLW
jgi:hypothetical protein